MSEPDQRRPGLLVVWCSMVFDLWEQALHVVEANLTTSWESTKPTRGLDFDAATGHGAPAVWTSGPIHIDSNDDRHVRLFCRELRQIGGGKPIPSDRVTFDLPSVERGPNRVVAHVDMTGFGVGVWTGDIRSRHNPEVIMSPDPLMVAWPGAL